ncbi:MAG TPA: LON peptidase substrate-binding domain-containing protein [Cyclobacteriaceae bacterium]|nr:LON peptidase substrate-binding domain-containing protein [Cyclobacteriaceae bacterium]
MPQTVLAPMFPLALLPLPGELVPLHIFEHRYREMVREAETQDISFGIYFSHEINTAKLGSMMRLESILKKYPSGESDIVVRCFDIFNLDTLYRKFKDRPYPGGDIKQWNILVDESPGYELSELFYQYRTLRSSSQRFANFTTFQIANDVNLDFLERYKFLISTADTRQRILINRLKFLIHSLKLELKSRDLYHLN